jgi:sigma-B regulation protein RsbU (phosphoserine phosphatase)
MIFIYTDGVTEAMDPEQKLYSEDRLMQTVTDLKTPLAPSLVKAINESVTEFARGAEQSDDITMLAMQYCGKCGK